MRKLLNRKSARDLQFSGYCTMHTYVHVFIIYGSGIKIISKSCINRSKTINMTCRSPIRPGLEYM